MSLILSGTDGLSDVDGSAATPAIRGTDANTGIFFPAADTIAFSEGGVESMRITPDGNVGIGVTPSATWSSSARAIQLGGFNSIFGYTNNVFRLANNAIFTASNETYGASSIGATYYQQYNGAHSWYNAASGTAGNAISFTQAMTLDASGNLLVGTTSPNFSTGNGAILVASGRYLGTCTNDATIAGSRLGSDGNVAAWYRGVTLVGSISVTASSCAFNNLSDYRVKENVTPLVGALSKVSKLKPCTYTFTLDGSVGEGFIAHELAEVCPQAVTGEKDAVEIYTDEDGNEQTRPAYQGVDTSFLIATLTAAIQEQQAIITQLQADVAALKAPQGTP